MTDKFDFRELGSGTTIIARSAAVVSWQDVVLFVRVHDGDLTGHERTVPRKLSVPPNLDPRGKRKKR